MCFLNILQEINLSYSSKNLSFYNYIKKMHFQFKARLGQNEISILVSKDMSVQEMLDALSFALQLPPYS